MALPTVSHLSVSSMMMMMLTFMVMVCAMVNQNVAYSAVLPEEYWNTVLRKTPMPKAITDNLRQHPDVVVEEEKKGTSVGVGKSGVNVKTGKPGGGTQVIVGKGGVNVRTGKQKPGSGAGGGRGGVIVKTPGKGKSVNVGVAPFLYHYGFNANQQQDNPTVAVFFLEKAMVAGDTMKLQFTPTTTPTGFLPRKEAESIPFSSGELPLILSKFSVEPNSEEASAMRKTIQECEEPVIDGEEKLCATSLEAMVDFGVSKLGKEVKVFSTEAEEGELQEYRIKGVRKMNRDEKAVVCHEQRYEYAVFYCHKTKKTKTYVVSMVGEDGSEVEAAAVCHLDTSAWNPKHLAFQLLKIKPGTLPVCHFLPQNHVVWVSN